MRRLDEDLARRQSPVLGSEGNEAYPVVPQAHRSAMHALGVFGVALAEDFEAARLAAFGVAPLVPGRGAHAFADAGDGRGDDAAAGEGNGGGGEDEAEDHCFGGFRRCRSGGGTSGVSFCFNAGCFSQMCLFPGEAD